MTETHTTGYCAPQISVVEMLTATGCNKEEVSTDVIKYVSEITIGFETRTRVSTSHSTAGLKFAWEDGDVIEVYKNADANSLTYYYVYDAASKTFKPQNKNYKMVAGTEGTIATMHHLVGVIEIPVKKGESFSEKITQFGIQASGSKIGRDFTATPASPYFKEASEGYEVTDSEEKSEYVLSTTEATIEILH